MVQIYFSHATYTNYGQTNTLLALMKLVSILMRITILKYCVNVYINSFKCVFMIADTKFTLNIKDHELLDYSNFCEM